MHISIIHGRGVVPWAERDNFLSLELFVGDLKRISTAVQAFMSIQPCDNDRYATDFFIADGIDFQSSISTVCADGSGLPDQDRSFSGVGWITRFVELPYFNAEFI